MGGFQPLWEFKEPRKAYDAVIIGGGLHGLAAAYYLARDHKVGRIAVLEKNRLGYGGSGRNTEIIRANQRAPEIIPLYYLAVELWNELSAEIGFNFLVWMKGVVGLVHNDPGLINMRLRAETHNRMGIKTDILTIVEIQKLVPTLDLSDKAAIPIVGGYYHQPGGQVHHDAAVWGFAKGCQQLGVDLCVGVEVTGFEINGDKVRGVETNKGFISTPIVHMATGGYSSEVARLAGVTLPVVTFPLQAIVTEPIKPFLNHVLFSELYYCYIQQTLKGDFITGSHMDPWQSYKSYNTYDYAAEQAWFVLQLFPDLAHVRLMRTWSGLCDMTADAAPVMGDCEIEGLYMDVGWGYFGFKASPACGKVMAEHMATGRRPEMNKYLGIERFYEGRMILETYFARN